MPDNNGTTSPEQVLDANVWNPPGGELSLDELFPNPELTPQAPPQIQAPAPQAPPPEEFFLKAGTGTVYRTKEDAVRGTEEKDRTIERLKNELAQLKAQTATTQPEQPASHREFAKQFFARLSKAASEGDAEAYANTLAEFQLAVLEPYRPLMSNVAKENAIRANEAEVKDIRTFIGSPAYRETLERFPTLKQAIEAAETYPQLAHQLPEFYRLAHESYVARKAVETNQALSTQQFQQQHTAQTPLRPTLTSSTPTPVPSQSALPSMTREQMLADPKARAEWLKRFREERAGLLNTDFGSIGL
jgi:ribosomal protein L29